MFLTVHSATGLLIGQYIQNPLWAFLSGFILHYILDIIPHGDTKIDKKYNNIIFITIAGIVDTAIMVSYLLIFMLIKNEFLTLSQIAAIIGSVLPDFQQLIYFINPRNKYSKKIFDFHAAIHNFLASKFQFSLKLGLTMQILLFIFILSLIF